MTTSPIARAAAAIVLTALALAAVYQALEHDGDPTAAPSTHSTATTEGVPGSLYGRVTTSDGTTYEGGLRWGGHEEAFWGHYFNGFKDENPWLTQVPSEQLNDDHRPIEVFGFEIARGERRIDPGRPFMARFGDLARIEARGDGMRGVLEDGVAFDPDVRVTLKSGTVFDLDRLSASDFGDGVNALNLAACPHALAPRTGKQHQLRRETPWTRRWIHSYRDEPSYSELYCWSI